MSEHPFPQTEEPQHAGLGEPDSGNVNSDPHETLTVPPFASVPWQPPSRFASSVRGGVTFTLRITPYLITAWIFAPAEIKYELRKQARWLPWAAKYAAWWLRQEGW